MNEMNFSKVIFRAFILSILLIVIQTLMGFLFQSIFKGIFSDVGLYLSPLSFWPGIFSAILIGILYYVKTKQCFDLKMLLSTTIIYLVLYDLADILLYPGRNLTELIIGIESFSPFIFMGVIILFTLWLSNRLVAGKRFKIWEEWPLWLKGGIIYASLYLVGYIIRGITLYNSNLFLLKSIQKVILTPILSPVYLLNHLKLGVLVVGLGLIIAFVLGSIIGLILSIFKKKI